MEEVSHVRAELNPAVLGTRELAESIERNTHSQWKTGPSFLTLPHEKWPLRDRAAINRGRESATAVAAEPSTEGAQPASKDTLSTNDQYTTEQKGHPGMDQLGATQAQGSVTTIATNTEEPRASLGYETTENQDYSDRDGRYNLLI